MYNKRYIKADGSTLGIDLKSREEAMEIARDSRGRFSAERGEWVQVDARTHVFRLHKPGTQHKRTTADKIKTR